MGEGKGGTPAEEMTDWDEFEGRLAAYLATMNDPTDADYLCIEMPGGGQDGCPPYAQFQAFSGGRMLHAELSGNAHLLSQFQLDERRLRRLAKRGWEGGDAESPNLYVERPVAHAKRTARRVVAGLRDVFCIPAPGLLAFHTNPEATERAAEMLGLVRLDDVPVEVDVAQRSVVHGQESVLGRLALKPVDRDDLLHILGSLLREKYENEPTADDDGDFLLMHMGQAVYVRVRQDQPAVEIIARVAHDVRSRRATAVELGILNRDHSWVRWVLRDHMVFQTYLQPAFPFVPSHFSDMLDLFLEAMADTRDDLAYRAGAKVA